MLIPLISVKFIKIELLASVSVSVFLAVYFPLLMDLPMSKRNNEFLIVMRGFLVKKKLEYFVISFKCG